MTELLSSTSSRELAEWMAYEQLEPFGEVRGDLRMARICLAIAQSGGAKDVKLSDFMLDFTKAWREQPKLSIEQQAKVISSALPKQKDGILVLYEGDAPPIKKIGKRGRLTPAKKRLQEILRGKSR